MRKNVLSTSKSIFFQDTDLFVLCVLTYIYVYIYVYKILHFPYQSILWLHILVVAKTSNLQHIYNIYLWNSSIFNLLLRCAKRSISSHNIKNVVRNTHFLKNKCSVFVFRVYTLSLIKLPNNNLETYGVTPSIRIM